MRIDILPAEASHAQAMSGRFRQADIREVWDSAHLTPEEAIYHGIEVSDEAWTAFIEGVPICCFGVAPVTQLQDVGAPWLVGTNELEDHAYLFLKGCKPMLKRFLDVYPTLLNFVDPRNDKAMRWAKWLGFTVFDPTPYGCENLPFCMFEIRRA